MAGQGMKIRVIGLAGIEEPALSVRLEDRQEGLELLARSMDRHGLLQPIVVRELGKDSYQLVAGRRRTLAAQLLGWETIHARVLGERDTYDELTLVENLQREDLGPIEEALAFSDVLQRTGWTQEALAQEVGATRDYVAKRLMLLDLDENTAAAVHDGAISMSAGLELKRIEDVATRQYYVEHAKRYGSPVTTVRYWVQNWLADQAAAEEAGEDLSEREPLPPPREAEMRCFSCEAQVPVSQVVSVALCKVCLRVLESAAYVAKEGG